MKVLAAILLLVVVAKSKFIHKKQQDDKFPNIAEINMKHGLKSDMRHRYDEKEKRYVPELALWPAGKIPFAFDLSVSENDKFYIEEFIDDFNKKFHTSCGKNMWTRRTTEPDYVHITTNEEGCWSYVGKINGAQQLNVEANNAEGWGCVHKRVVQHEMMHAMGIFHQQSRCDRDQFVNINLNNVPNGYEGNFEKESGTNAYEEYDYYSLMHYGLKYFSTNGGETISVSPNYPGIDVDRIGDAATLSSKDERVIRMLYQCQIPDEAKSCKVDCATGSLVCEGGCTCGIHGVCNDDAECICEPGYAVVSHKCVKSECNCGEFGSCNEDNTCACHSGYVEHFGVCIPACNCGENALSSCDEDGSCRCHSGYVEVNGYCEQEMCNEESCGENGECVNNECKCDEGSFLQTDVCVKEEVNGCSDCDPFTEICSEEQKCVCMEGFHRNDQKECVQQPTALCLDDEYFDTQQEKCMVNPAVWWLENLENMVNQFRNIITRNGLELKTKVKKILINVESANLNFRGKGSYRYVRDTASEAVVNLNYVIELAHHVDQEADLQGLEDARAILEEIMSAAEDYSTTDCRGDPQCDCQEVRLFDERLRNGKGKCRLNRFVKSVENLNKDLAKGIERVEKYIDWTINSHGKKMEKYSKQLNKMMPKVQQASMEKITPVYDVMLNQLDELYEMAGLASAAFDSAGFAALSQAIEDFTYEITVKFGETKK